METNQIFSSQTKINEEWLRPLNVGEIVEAEIIKKEGNRVYFSLKNFGTGIIYGREYQKAKDFLKNLNVGDKALVKILELDNEEGLIELSLQEAEKDLNWESLKKIKEENQSFKVKILKANKGGLLTFVNNVPSFIPVSQLSAEHYPKVEGGDKNKILKELQKLIGQELEVKILTLDKKNRALILSEKMALFDRAKEYLKSYQIGEIVEGRIVKITDFGAFIRFPIAGQNPERIPETIEGLIHISEIDHRLLSHPSEVLKVGDIVTAKIIEIKEGRVLLSIKALKNE